MNSLQQFLIKFKKNGSDKPTHTIIPDKNSKLPEIKPKGKSLRKLFKRN